VAGKFSAQSCKWPVLSVGLLSRGLGSVGAQLGGKYVEPANEVVVELHQQFTSSHDHMLRPMVDGCAVRALVTAL
jgi:hypothetical protein